MLGITDGRRWLPKLGDEEEASGLGLGITKHSMHSIRESGQQGTIGNACTIWQHCASFESHERHMLFALLSTATVGST